MSNLTTVTAAQSKAIQASNTAIIKALNGKDDLKNLPQEEAGLSLYLNREQVLNSGDTKQNKAIIAAIKADVKIENDLRELRDVIIAGIVDPKKGLVTDDKLIEKSKAAIATYCQRLAVTFCYEKDMYISDCVKQSGKKTESAFFDSLNGNQWRSLMAATTGVPRTESGKKAFTMALKRAGQKAVANGVVSEEDFKARMISFRADGSQIKALPPVERVKELTSEEKAAKEAQDAKRAIEKAVNAFAALDANGKHAAIKAMAMHTANDLEIIISACNEVKSLDDKVEEIDPNSELVADYREAKSFLEASGKGNKKPTKAQLAKMTAAVEKAESDLVEAGIDPKTIH